MRLSARPEVHERRRANEHPARRRYARRVILRSRKTSPVFARVEERRRAVADAVGDPTVTERHGAQNPGVRQRASGRPRPRDESLGARMRERMRPSARSNFWRV